MLIWLTDGGMSGRISVSFRLRVYETTNPSGRGQRKNCFMPTRQGIHFLFPLCNRFIYKLNKETGDRDRPHQVELEGVKTKKQRISCQPEICCWKRLRTAHPNVYSGQIIVLRDLQELLNPHNSPLMRELLLYLPYRDHH